LLLLNTLLWGFDTSEKLVISEWHVFIKYSVAVNADIANSEYHVGIFKKKLWVGHWNTTIEGTLQYNHRGESLIQS